jgi:hypothetical protein
MILFPLMISWVWLQIFTASPLVFSAAPLEDLHVSDDLGDELFVLPFAFVLGKPH